MAAVQLQDRLLAAALRGRHDASFDGLARHALLGSPARSHAARLCAGESLPARSTEPRSTLPFAVALATAWFGAARDEREQTAAVELYRQVVTTRGPAALRRVERRHYLQAAFILGRHDLVRRGLEELDGLTEDVLAGLRADLANPLTPTAGLTTSHERWEQLLGSRFVARDLQAPHVDPTAPRPFDGLHLTPSRTVDGPRVTVVVPCFRPDRGLATSVRSIVAQTWANLEIIVVDDASGPAYRPLFEEVEALDPRVTLLRQEVNGGSYLARNAALEVATGRFVTTQDADDWSHPERVAVQVDALEGAPQAPASRSTAIRARPDLTRQWFGYRPERMNASSLLVRRDVLERVGGFDAVRKGADSELQERLGLIGEVVGVTRPLAITRLASGSLSRADFALGRHSPDRVLFRSAFRHWHAKLVAGDASTPDDLALRRSSQRPFPVPRSFVRGLPAEDHAVARTYRAVVVVDQADPFPAGVDPHLVELILGGQDQEHPGGRSRWAVLAREDLTRAAPSSPDWSGALLDAASAGQVDLLTDHDEVEAETLILLEPDVYAVPAQPLPALTAGEVLVAAVPPGEGERPRDLEAAGALVRTLHGRPPRWAARSQAERLVWKAQGWHLPTLIDCLTGRQHPSTGGTVAPVAPGGRTS